ncbi:hypothetical protein GCU67_05645 [Modestobacter muralis]|uniref:Uncharacterized protein n=1 Tax=Modestobacter muralis TaxID=1608614 RepID=A0A6P0H3Y8_9ACTN|nr:hypothetical protein [Modestobacter muralis]NEK93660.1 hypothetical protein [Modestobacter muralis]NEN50427.1 hypothetical protein [Modestobacter muralis]
MSRRTPRRLLAVLALSTFVLLLPGVAQAKGGDDGAVTEDGGGGGAVSGDFAVTVNGRTSNPAAGRDFRVSGVAPTSPVVVTGRNVTFRIDPTTLGVYDYTLTGAASPERMVTAPTVVFASKVPVLTPAQRTGVRIEELRLRDDTLVVTFSTAAGKLKVQSKDAPQGGIFQMEQEFGAPVEFVHTLGTGLFYFVNEFTGKVNFGNGVDADATHQMLLGKDSPQVATKLAQTATSTRWSVTSGGRMGGVLGEDAIELSAGATNCTSDCQARNRVQGSLPVPPDPTDPTPIG